MQSITAKQSDDQIDGFVGIGSFYNQWEMSPSALCWMYSTGTPIQPIDTWICTGAYSVL